jgi:2-C-methyl-D-erythritol 4-phosphate cytidylyltransferase/2-C-methyl-D-erythritol 2,4-cyclodiphosphate synthase
MRIAAVLLAAGAGTRFGQGLPKQFQNLLGQPVVRRAAAALLSHVDLIQPVGDALLLSSALDGVPHLAPVPGGETRNRSVMAGLDALERHSPDIVLIHDGARPLVPSTTIPDLVRALSNADGAIPAIGIAETIKRVLDEKVQTTVPRQSLYRAQTPQAFWYVPLLAAYRNAAPGNFTDDASVLEACGKKVVVVPGSEYNVKVTFPEDLRLLERIMSAHFYPRVGTGFDVHAFAPDRALWLCGTLIPSDKGLAGHSDADVGIHALCDAIYGALADGDIGMHFPPREDIWKDAASIQFLEHAAGLITSRQGILSNVDLTFICERPKIAPHAAEMRRRLSGVLTVPVSRISIKATTTEGLGFAGRGEGIAAQAAVTVLLPLQTEADYTALTRPAAC